MPSLKIFVFNSFFRRVFVHVLSEKPEKQRLTHKDAPVSKVAFLISFILFFFLIDVVSMTSISDSDVSIGSFVSV